jgi:predicted alpha/beta-fold hydrolase
MENFNPSPLFKNPHIQSIFSAMGPRKLLVQHRAKALMSHSQDHIIDCNDGIRLTGKYSYKPENKQGLVIMIHGWLGCNDSLYLLSSGSKLFSAGYNIFRLNLRDHGNSGYLNKELFNSSRIKEVVNAVKEIQNLFPHRKNYLTGFSLGGNFCLRVAARATESEIQIKQVVAICPVINPYKTNRNLHDGLFVYHHYFRNRWKNSLIKKLEHFPEHDYRQKLDKLKTLDEMNSYFVPNHTSFNNVDNYLNAYSIGGDYLENLDIPSHIISSQDDPVILCEDLNELPNNKKLTIELTRHGGHCGYIEGLNLDSWVDNRILTLLRAN